MPASAKKATAIKSSSAQKEKSIKYSDKSAGQPELVAIFNELRELFLPFERGVVSLIQDGGGQTHLHSNKEVEIAGKKRDGLYFTSLLVQKGYVGLYLMPAWDKQFLKTGIGPDLLNLLKGKTCFLIKKLDDSLKSQVRNALENGYKYYLDKGWA